MSERVTAIDPRTFGSDSRVADYIHKPLWWLIPERTIVFCITHYWLFGFVAALLWVRSTWRFDWWLGAAVVLAPLTAVGLVWLALMLLVVGGLKSLGRFASRKFLVMIWRMFLVNWKWHKICFAAAVVNRRGRSTPNIWLLHLSRDCRGVRGYVIPGRLGLPMSKFEDEWVQETICASLPAAVAIRVSPTDLGRGWIEILWEDPLAAVVPFDSLEEK